MTQWIDCNLPWSVNPRKFVYPIPAPDLSDQERERFGVSKEDLQSKYSDEFSKLDRLFSQVTWKVPREDVPKQEDIIARDNGLSEALDAKRLVKQIEWWRDYTPEYQAWQDAQAVAYRQFLRESQSQTFAGQELNRPGVQIEVDGRQYLIGDINTTCGVCEDCTAFEPESIVTRYRVLVDL